jgi:hypothetical protein
MKKTIVLAGLLALSLGCWLANAPGNADDQDRQPSSPPRLMVKS